MIYPIFLLMFPIILLFIFAEVNDVKVSDNASFYAIIGLIITFIIDMIRRSIQRKWEKQDRLESDAKAKREREEFAIQAKVERDEIARKVQEEAEKVKSELALFQAEQLKATDRRSHEIVDKLETQEQTVREIDKKVVTLQVADQHKKQVIDAIEKNTQAVHESSDKATEAYEKANTINEKIAQQQQAGLDNLTDGKAQQLLREIEKSENEDTEKN